MKTVPNNNHWIVEQFNRNPQSSAILTNNIEYTYTDVYKDCVNCALHLKNKGVRKTDNVAIVLSNSYEFIIIVHALWLLGVVPVPINLRLSRGEIIKQIKFADCVHVITNDKKNFHAEGLNIIESKELRKESHNNIEFIPEKFIIDKVALLMYTSGSTSKPKCVEITFDNLLSNYNAINDFVKHDNKDIWLASLPFYHIGGFVIITRCILAGCSILVPKTLKYYDIEEAIKKFQPSYISFVGIMLERFLNSKIDKWLNLKKIFMGGGPISHKILNDAINIGLPIATVYGSTETTSMVTAADIDNLIENGITAGKKLLGVEVKLSKNHEIIIEGKQVAKGYYKIVNSKNLKDGKYFSNDIGRFDQEGNLIVIGRKDDIIISGGENISLLDIETRLNENDAFRNTTTITVTDEKWGQSYILVTDSKTIKIEEQLTDFIRNNLGSFKLPKKIIVIDKIPISPLGKVKKAELRKMLNLNS